jgi:hypothetical protein
MLLFANGCYRKYPIRLMQALRQKRIGISGNPRVLERASSSFSMAAVILPSSSSAAAVSRLKEYNPRIRVAGSTMFWKLFRASKFGRRLLHAVFSIRKFSKTRASISLLEKVSKALAGVLTMGSPFRLKDVFSTTGMPVACPKRSIRR